MCLSFARDFFATIFPISEQEFYNIVAGVQQYNSDCTLLIMCEWHNFKDLHTHTHIIVNSEPCSV